MQSLHITIYKQKNRKRTTLCRSFFWYIFFSHKKKKPDILPSNTKKKRGIRMEEILRMITRDMAIDTETIVHKTENDIYWLKLNKEMIGKKRVAHIMETFHITHDMSFDRITEILEENKKELIDIYHNFYKNFYKFSELFSIILPSNTKNKKRFDIDKQLCNIENDNRLGMEIFASETACAILMIKISREILGKEIEAKDMFEYIIETFQITYDMEFPKIREVLNNNIKELIDIYYNFYKK